MRIPYAFTSVLRLRLDFPPLEVFLRGLSLDLLELRPPIPEQLKRQICPVDFRVSKIAGRVALFMRGK